MIAHHSRKLVFGLLLASALSAPAFANDGLTSVGQIAVDVASLQTDPTIVEENFATETNGRMAPPGTQPGATARRELSPKPTVRQPNGVHRVPLILGIGY